ncbi:AraC-like DNA-binding protein [Streptococcus rupicaprae]|uniref:AraC-like DNA-binding protein n=1 Tax=Streptococcus rupicaprae TaxID=759619 RepID=A0ABV2FIW0_9STRE
MDRKPLLTFISKKLHLPIIEFKGEEIIAIYNENPELSKHLELENLNLSIFHSISYHPYPYIFELSNNIVFTYISADQSSFLLGPCLLKSELNLLHSLPVQTKFETEIIPDVRLELLLELGCLLFNCLKSTDTTTQEMLSYNVKLPLNITKSHFTQQYYTSQEQQLSHNSYYQEVREFNSIEEGNLLKLQESWNEDYGGEIGILANDNLRNTKNLAIVVITLASRSAMRGGLHPEIAYTMSDNFIRTVESFTYADDIIQFIRQAEIEFTLMVRQHKVQTESGSKDNLNSSYSHPFVKKARQYIGLHLHQQIKLQDITESLNCSISYLSSLFKSELNMSIQTYIISEKINYAELLLIYSDKPLNEIASSLGFSSQSYFGKIFKKKNHYSPLKFRQRFGY